MIKYMYKPVHRLPYLKPLLHLHVDMSYTACTYPIQIDPGICHTDPPTSHSYGQGSKSKALLILTYCHLAPRNRQSFEKVVTNNFTFNTHGLQLGQCPLYLPCPLLAEITDVMSSSWSLSPVSTLGQAANDDRASS
ncbi:hypothetical protein BaRGS_00036423 [Batillaria attramentaria]|uniref:Uncharacterized protein n=1 Tax=Batillaria attramentaria TaxID=370345 RepID=A0ABD0JC50_9CAEN